MNKKLHSKSILNLTSFYRKNKWMPYSPQVLYDINEKKIVNLKESSDDLLMEAGTHLIQNDQSLLSKIGFWKFYNINFKIYLLSIPLLCLFLFGLNLYLKIDPAYFFRSDHTILLSPEKYKIFPSGIFFFYGQPLKLQILLLSKDHQFLGFEFSKKDDSFERVSHLSSRSENIGKNRAYTLDLPALTEDFSFRGVFAYGAQKKYSITRSIKTVRSAHFKGTIFRITPPAYTGLSVYSSKDNLLRLYYGSHVSVNISTSHPAQLFYGPIELKESKPGLYNHHFNFKSLEVKKLQYTLRSVIQSNKTDISGPENVASYLKDSNVLEVQSPVYEILPAQDSSPRISILKKGFPGDILRLPEKGKLKWSFRIEDDFGVRSVYVFIRHNDKLIDRIPISLSSLKESKISKAGGGRSFLGQAKIDLAKYNEMSFSITMGVRDNSMILEAFTWDKKPSLGQIGYSNTFRILFAKDHETKEKWNQKELQKVVKELGEFQSKYQESEEKLLTILKQAQSRAVNKTNQNEQELKQKLKEWVKERKLIQKNLKDLEKDLKQNITPQNEYQVHEKKKILENISTALSEKIDLREKQLQKLLKNFSSDFNVFNRAMDKMSKKEYLKNLENSIIRLTKLLMIRKIDQLYAEIQKQIKYLEELKYKFVKRDENTRVPDIVSGLTSQEKNFKEIRDKSRNIQKEAGQKLSDPGISLGPDPKDAEYFIQKTQEAKTQVRKKESKGVISMTEMRRVWQRWKKKIEEMKNRIGVRDFEKVAYVFRRSAFSINKIAGVWQDKISDKDIFVNMGQTESRSFGKSLSILKDSYKAVIHKMIMETRFIGLVNPEIVNKLNEVYHYFDQIQNSLENHFPMSAGSHSKGLIWKLNQTSLMLLKEMEGMNINMAQISNAEAMNKMNEADDLRKEILNRLKELAQEQMIKNESLNSLEKQYVQDLLEQEKKITKDLKKYSSEAGLKDTSLQKEIDSLGKELIEAFKKSDLRLSNRIMEKLKNKLLHYKKSVQTKKEFSNKRESETAKEYTIKYSTDSSKIPAKKPPHLAVPDLRGYSHSQKIFFYNYLQNLHLMEQQRSK